MMGRKGKENEMRERSKERKEKESVLFAQASARAHEGEVLPPVIDVRTPPSLKLLLAFAHIRCRFYDDAFTREWHRVMKDEYLWLHPETGTPIRHWPAYFRLWRTNEAYFAKLRDPDRIPDVRKGGGTKRKSDNWRGTKEGEVGDVLG